MTSSGGEGATRRPAGVTADPAAREHIAERHTLSLARLKALADLREKTAPAGAEEEPWPYAPPSSWTASASPS